MRKQAEQLVVGRVYADVPNEKVAPVFIRYKGRDEKGNVLVSFVNGLMKELNGGNEDTFTPMCALYELTPIENVLYNDEQPTFTLSDIQRVIEVIEKKIELQMRYYRVHWSAGLQDAIEIMREELKIK